MLRLGRWDVLATCNDGWQLDWKVYSKALRLASVKTLMVEVSIDRVQCVLFGEGEG